MLENENEKKIPKVEFTFIEELVKDLYSDSSSPSIPQ